jgi:hypothetical protein
LLWEKYFNNLFCNLMALLTIWKRAESREQRAEKKEQRKKKKE